MNFKHQLTTVVIVILIIIVCGFLLFEFGPQASRALNLRSKLKTRRGNFKNIKREIASKKKVMTAQAEQNLSEERIAEAIPQQLNTKEFLGQIKELLATAKLNFNRYNPKETIKKKDYQKLPIYLEISGDYQSLNSFYEELEKSNRLVTIEKIDLVNSGQQLKNKLLIAIYSLNQEEDVDE
jgi:Tfp pilus assembly protein PilO